MFSSRKRSKSRDKNEPRVLDEVLNIIDNDTIRSESFERIDNSVHDQEELPGTEPENFEFETDSVSDVRSPRSSRSHSRDRNKFKAAEREIRNMGVDKEFRNTIKDGLGKNMLEVNAQLKEVSKALNIPFKITDDNVCHDFNDHTNAITSSILKQITKTFQNLKADMYDQMNERVKALDTSKQNKNRLNLRIKDAILPPDNFSNEDVIKDHKSIQIANDNFPIKSKFSGTNSVSVVEYLNNLNYAQYMTNCSEKEFRRFMLKSTTGQAYNEISNLLDGNVPLEDIYTSLLLRYDTRSKPEAAKRELENFRTPVDASFDSVVSSIMNLGQRAKFMYAKEAREHIYDTDCTRALEKALPFGFNTEYINHYNLLVSELGRVPTFNELVSQLGHVSTSIDAHYKDERGSRYRNRYEVNQFRKSNYYPNTQGGKSEDRKKHAQIRLLKETPQTYPPRDIDNKDYSKHGSYYNLSDRKNVQNQHFDKHVHDSRTEAQSRHNIRSLHSDADEKSSYKVNDRSMFKRDGPVGRGRLHCSLCGASNHSASDGCFKMRSNSGKLAFVAPSSGHCDTCLAEAKQILHHPSERCFRRPKYLELVKQGVIKYPTKDEIKAFRDFIARETARR